MPENDLPDRHDREDPDSTRQQARPAPVEYQRYGPAPHDTRGHAPSWQPSSSWSTQPPQRVVTVERRSAPLLPVAVVALTVGLISGTLGAVATTNLLRETTITPATTTSDDTAPVSNVHIDESSAVVNAVEAVAPAVVTIRSQQNGVFGSAEGSGSGFIYDSAGWILTNKHVVEGATDLQVLLQDKRTFPVESVQVDTLTDLAIVKIDGKDLPSAPIGSSNDLKPGQLAIAIGNPLGNYENSVTTGVVSGLGRRIQAGGAQGSSAEQLNNLIQTDAAINPGNSGGPLVNSAGQVIGVNTAVSTDAQGIGFAIPIDVARPIMEQAVAGDPLARPWIGVYYEPLTPAIADERGLNVDSGALVGGGPDDAGVVAGSPAEAAGLQVGDVIVAVDGERLDDGDLAQAVLPHKPGDVVTLRIVRGQSTEELTVTLGEYPAAAG
jgi:S1-C subfamily serine protease